MSESARRINGQEAQAGVDPQELHEPSIIVCMESLAPAGVSAAPPPRLLSEVAQPPSRPSREAMAETIRFRVPAPPQHRAGSSSGKGLMWTAVIGGVLFGITVWAWLGVSLASSEKSQIPTKVLPPVATDLRAGQSRPLILPFVQPVPEKNDALPRVSLSHLDITWGDAPERRVRVAMRRSISTMKACFAHAHRHALTFPDKLGVLLRLDERGMAKWVSGLRSGGSSSTQKCVEGAIRDTRFPPSRTGLLVSAKLVFTRM